MLRWWTHGSLNKGDEVDVLVSKNVFKDTAVLTYTRVITMVTSLVYSMILTRALSKYDYGVFSQAQIVITFFVTFFGLSLPNCVNFFLPSAKDSMESRKVISNITTLCVIVGVFCCVGIVVSSPFLASFFNQQGLMQILLIGSGIPCCQLLANVYDNTFVVLGNTKLVALRRTMFSVLKVIIGCILWALQLSFVVFYFLLFLLELLIGIYSAVCVLRSLNGKLFGFIDLVFLKKLLQYALPLGISSIVSTINVSLGKLIISKLSGAEALAIYSAMTQELPVSIIATSVAAVGVPLVATYLVEGRKNEVHQLWNQTTELSFILTSWIIGVLFVLAPEAITFLYSSKYLSGILIFRISLMVLLFRTVNFGMILSGAGKTKKILLSSSIGLTANIILIVGLFPVLGSYAPVVSNLLSIAVMALLLLISSSSVLNCTVKTIFPWKNIGINVLVNCVIALPCFLLAEFLRSFSQNAFVVLLFCSCLWLLLIVLCYFKRVLHLKNTLSN